MDTNAHLVPHSLAGLGRFGIGIILGAGACLTPLQAAEVDAEITKLEVSIRAKGLDATAADHRRLGDAYLAAGRITEAAGTYDRALAAGATDREFLTRLGLLWEASGRVDRAVPVYASAVKADPQHPDAAGLLLRSALITEQIAGDPKRAIGFYRQAAEAYPGSPEAKEAIDRGWDAARSARDGGAESGFGVLAIEQFPTDRRLVQRVGLSGARHLSTARPDRLIACFEALSAEHERLVANGALARYWADALHAKGESDKGVDILVRCDQLAPQPSHLWAAAEFAEQRAKDKDRARDLSLALIERYPLYGRVPDAAKRAERNGADVSALADVIATAEQKSKVRNEMVKGSEAARRAFSRDKGKGDGFDQLVAWFASEQRPMAVWPWEVLDARCELAARQGDVDAYRDALLLLMQDEGQRYRAIDGLALNHGVPGAWIDGLVAALQPSLVGDAGLQARLEYQLAERARRAGDRAGMITRLSTVLKEHAGSSYAKGIALHMLLRSAIDAGSADATARYAAAVEEHVRVHSGRGGETTRLLSAAYEGQINAWPRERKVAYWELIRDVGREDTGPEWVASDLVRSYLQAGDPAAAACDLHRSIHAGRWDRSQHYDGMMKAAEVLVEAGHHGLAAGAYDHIARRFTRVGDERIQRARQLAGQEMAQLGGAVVEALMDIDDDDPLAPILRAQAKLSLGDEEESYRLIKPALRLMQENADRVSLDLVLSVSRNLAKERRYDDATNLLQAWIRSGGGGEQGAAVQLAIGDVRFAAENFPAALLEFQSVIASYPDSSAATDARLRIGDCHLAMRQYDEALGIYQQVLNHEDEEVRAKATFRVAVLESERGNDDAALELFREVARMNPPKDLANRLYLDWGKALIDRNRLSEAEDVIMMVGLQAGREPIAPGEPLRITLNDPFLHTSQNRSSVPVLVTTSSGDQEIVELTLSQDVKGMFTSRLPTTLGETKVGDSILQITGDDTISYDYTDDFKKNRKTMTIGSGEIPIASEGRIKVSASTEGVRFEVEGDEGGDLSNLGLSFDTEELKLAREIASSASRTFRGEDHIKPGNPVYLAVMDGDRDVSSGADTVKVVVGSSAGDQVQVELTETGPHTGLFRGEMNTGLMPPDVEVTDTATGSDPLSLLLAAGDPDFEDAESAWVAAGDLKGGKAVTLDFKAVRPVDRFLWSRGWAVPPGERAKQPSKQPGLACTVWAGTKQDGQVLLEELSLPMHKNRDIPGHGGSNWSARWVGEIQVPVAGTYTVEARSDDGCEITLGGTKIYEGAHWRDQGPTSKSATVPLAAGWQPIQIDYYQGGGGGELAISFGPEGQIAPLTMAQLRARPSVGVGPEVARTPTRYRIEISANGEDWTPIARDGAGVLPSGWLAASAADPREVPRSAAAAARSLLGMKPVRPDEHALKDKSASYLDGASLAESEGAEAERIHGMIIIPEAGIWEFAVRSGGRAFLAVGGTVVVEKDRDEVDDAIDPSAPRWRGAVELPYGLVPLHLLRSSDRGASGVEILWRRPGADAFEPIPTAAVSAKASGAQRSQLLGRGAAAVERLAGRRGEEIRFDPVPARFVRMVIDAWNEGDAPAVARVAAWAEDELIVPKAGVDYRALATNDVLELSAGDVVEASYLDRKTKTGVSEDRRGRLTATYYDGSLGFQEARSITDANGRLHEFLYERFRFQAGERLTVRVVDYDLDVSNKPDSVAVTLISSAGEERVTAIETGAATGVFQAEVKTAGTGVEAGDGVLVVADGEQVMATFMDPENLNPGGETKRSASIREAVTSAGSIAISPSTTQPDPRRSDGTTVVSYGEPVDGAVASVALAPIKITVTDPDSVISSGSEARVRLTTERGASVDVALRPLDDQSFEGTVALVLGSPETTDPWRLPAPGDDASTASLRIDSPQRGAQPVLPVRGGELITATYIEGLVRRGDAAAVDQALAASTLPSFQARLVTDGTLSVLRDDFETPIAEAYVGGKLFYRVVDADADTSNERDRVTLDIVSGFGDALALELEETESHSGIFTGSIEVTVAAQATPGDVALETTFGDQLEITYREVGRGSDAAPRITIPVSRGHDGVLDGFAKRFGDDKLAALTSIKMSECYFELYKTHREKLKELEESKGSQADIEQLQGLIAEELEAGTSLLRQTIHAYPDLSEIDEVLFLLANFEQEGGSQLEAIDRYRELLAGYPSSVRAPEAQYKMAQCYEELGRFDDAWDSYVRLAYRWPDHDLVADSMARIGGYYEQRGKTLLTAAESEWKRTSKADDFVIPEEAQEDLVQAQRIYGQLIDRFGDREIAPAILLKQGNCHWLLRDYLAAEAAFAAFPERYPDSPYLPTSMYWAGRAALEGGDARSAYLRFGGLIRDFPETNDAKRARGMMLQDARLKDISFTE